MMCRVGTFDLGGGSRAVGAARGATLDLLDRWALPGLRHDAALLVSELVTNAVLHGRGGIGLAVAVAEGVLEVGVTDRSPLLPVLRPARPGSASWGAEGGRGLRMVDEVADDWGVVALEDGKQVWFSLSVDERWPHLTECPCGGDDLDRVRLQSGRFAVAAPGPWDNQPARR
jgi:anti-sigma regulatory factor (Ser/Thr protein kinase)